MTPTEREASKAICDAATPDLLNVMLSDLPDDLDGKLELCIRVRDAAFIAHARTTLPAALAHMDEQDTEIERLRGLLNYAAPVSANQCEGPCPGGCGNQTRGAGRCAPCLVRHLRIDARKWQAFEDEGGR